MTFLQIYMILSILVEILLFVVMFNIRSSNNPLKKELIGAGIMGLVTIPIYWVFRLTTDYILAKTFNSIYFVCMDWLCYFMLMFSTKYNSYYSEKNIARKILIVVCIIDSIQIALSSFTNHAFDLSYIYSQFGYDYWALTLKEPFYLHLTLCYIIVVTSFVQFTISAIKVPDIYKRKFTSVLIAYIFVILLNFICLYFDYPIDFSNLLYSLFLAFIAYYSTYSAEKKILANSLFKSNEISKDAIVYFDLHGNCIYTNKKTRELFGLEKKVSKNKINQILEAFKDEIIASKKSIIEFSVNGEKEYYKVEYSEINENEDILGAFMCLHNYTAEIIQIKNEEYTANHDLLTDLYNRKQFFKKVQERIDNSEQLVMISTNIRDFKLINELFGGEIGDEVLLSLSVLVKKYAFSAGTYGRIADDKFAMVLPASYPYHEIFTKINNEIQTILKNNSYKINVIFGICKSHKDEAAQLFDKSQLAMEKIKNDYQEVYAEYDSEIMERVLTEKNITGEFEKALSADQFEMYLQPIYSNKKTISGAEALARWNHKEKGMLLPHYFLKTLEKTGLIYKLDVYMWDQALKFFHDFKEKLPEHFTLSINVSTRDIFYMDVFQYITKLIDDYKLDPHKIALEFTEDILTSDGENGIELLRKFMDYGTIVTIDNFGSGFTSLNLLKDVSCHCIKIDKELLNETENTQRSKIILTNIIEMAKSIGMTILSVGIESSEQFLQLKGNEIDYYQGFYFSKPLNLSDFEKLL